MTEMQLPDKIYVNSVKLIYIDKLNNLKKQ